MIFFWCKLLLSSGGLMLHIAYNTLAIIVEDGIV
jgi:hypothetical protein